MAIGNKSVKVILVFTALAFTACANTGGKVKRIAKPQDIFLSKSGLTEGVAGIVYDPDGCQNWIIDDGFEGYATPRYDPKSGLPICNDLFPPGTVLGEYRTEGGKIIPDYAP